MLTYRVENFVKGIVNAIEDRSIPAGAASRSLNWLTMGDHIELRRGQRRMGLTDHGSGKVKGFFVANKVGGNEIPFKVYGTKLLFYDAGTDDWIEVEDDGGNTDIIPAAASGDDVTMDGIETLAGAQLWLNSPNGSFFKVMIHAGDATNPPVAVDQYDEAQNFKGYIVIQLNRIKLWGRVADKTGLQGSYIDTRKYTTVSAEVLGTGDGLTKDYSGTLAFKGSGAKRTCFAIEVTDGTETFTDNRDGTLTGDQGGTGTINYATGAISVSFNANVTNLTNVTVDYQWENSTDEGLADFTESATRVAGEGFYFPQGDGGALKGIASLKSVDFCFHEHKSWRLELTEDDTDARNLMWRENVGVQSIRGCRGSGEGIYYIDTRDSNEVRIRIVTYDAGSSEEIPISLSDNLDLSDLRFDDAAVFEYGDFILVSCRTSDSIDSDDLPVNNRVLVYNKVWKSWDLTDYYVRMFDVYSGALHGGHSLNNNVFELFSGFDDDDSIIPNYWEGNLDEQGVAELKKTKKLRIGGLIAKDQKIKVSVSIDGGPFVEIGGSDDGGSHTYAIEGSGSYVDAGQSVTIGSTIIGKNVIGGGSDSVQVYNYLREIPFRQAIGKYSRVKIRFEGIAIGYASVSFYEFFDVTQHGPKIPEQYR